MRSSDYYWLIRAFSFLSFQDLHNCSEVSSGWREAALFEGLPQFKGSHNISTSELKKFPISFLSLLTNLNLSNKEVTDKILVAALPHLERVKEINLCASTVGDTFIRELECPNVLPTLTSLNLKGCKKIRDMRPIQEIAQHRFYSTQLHLGNNCFRPPNASSFLSTFSSYITFVNNTPYSVITNWLDFGGKFVECTKIPSGGWFTQSSYESHPWALLTEDYTEIMRLVATRKPQVVYIGDVFPNSLIPIPQRLATVAKVDSVTIVIHNKATTEVIDSDGMEEDNPILIPHGTRYDLQTHETVPWVIRDEDGRFDNITFIAKRTLHHSIIRLDGKHLQYHESC